jgi:hypothetical protein
MGKMNRIELKSFTFLEILMAVGILGFVLPIVFNIIFTILQQQIKITRLAIVKRQGDYVVNVVKNLVIGQMTGIYSEKELVNKKCDGFDNNQTYASSTGKDFFFKDINGAAVNIYLNQGKIATGPANINLTNDQVMVENYQIFCANFGSFTTPFVTVKFDIYYNTISTRPEDLARLSYQTSFRLRN